MSKTRKTRIVCISDTHNQTPKLPPGDVLIHAGDLTNQGSYSELKKTVEWLEKTDYEAKIVVAGMSLQLSSQNHIIHTKCK
jgi:3',5'-cyclic AMP phosphodiesterase CpdA